MKYNHGPRVLCLIEPIWESLLLHWQQIQKKFTCDHTWCCFTLNSLPEALVQLGFETSGCCRQGQLKNSGEVFLEMVSPWEHSGRVVQCSRMASGVMLVWQVSCFVWRDTKMKMSVEIMYKLSQVKQMYSFARQKSL